MGRAASQLSVVFMFYRGTQLSLSGPGLAQTSASIASTACPWEMSGQVRMLTKVFVLLSLWKPNSHLEFFGFILFWGGFCWYFFSICKGAKHLFSLRTSCSSD